MSARPPAPGAVDPFELPDWLGDREVTWVADDSLRGGHHVPGRLTAEGAADLACDLLAVDQAFPGPVADEETRTASHQAWRHGQVHLGDVEGRLVLLVPGAGFTADTVIEAVARLAAAVGADARRYAALLRIGASERRPRSTGR